MIIKIVYKAKTRHDFLLTIDEWIRGKDYYYFLFLGVEVHRERREDVKAVKAI